MMLALSALILQGCNKSFHDIGPPPQLTEVSHEVPLQEILIAPEPEVIHGPHRVSMTDNSIWDHQTGNYFRDTRAFKVGDILTVNISINDSARLNNTSGRETTIDGTLGSDSDITLPIFGTLPAIEADATVSAGVELERGGTVNRNERIELQVAAAVVASSENGNLHIVGSQEVRVNHELRILTVEGIVRAKDILPDNTIPYEKIAEARIIYGGHNSRQKPKPKRKWHFFGKPLLLSSLSE